MCFVILFFIFAFFVTFYSLGYQYNLKKNKFEKTGNLILTYRPREANVFINNELKLSTSILDNFVRLTRLLPGEYKIKISRAGYLDWQKKITVNPELTTSIQNIKLFRDKILPLKISSKIIFLKETNEKNKILLVKKEDGFNSLNLLNISNDQEIKLATTTSNIIDLNFSPDNKKMLSAEKNNLAKGREAIVFYLYSLENFSKKNIILPQDILWQKIKWDKENNDILYYSQKNKIYQLDLLNNYNKVILELGPIQTQIKDFIIKGNEIYLIINSDNSDYLTKLNKNDLKQIPQNKFLLDSKDYQFLNSPDLITLIDKNRNELAVFDNNLKKLLNDNAKDAAWAIESDDEKLLYYNDFEIIVYSLKEDKKKFIIRLSEPINKAIWFPDQQHLIFALDKVIKISELDLQDNNLTNYPLEYGATDLFINDKGNKLYFSSTNSTAADLYQFVIQ